jgi:hypothetical protein
MGHEEFRDILQGAIAGNHNDIEKLLQIYSPLLNSNSLIKGKLDEDLRQCIVLRIIKCLSKFNI